MDNFCRK